MNDTFTVKQDHGGDSVVEVSEYTEPGINGPIRHLSFYTTQSLASNSGRTWNVKSAIEQHCRERGFHILTQDQHSIEAYYDPRAHSGYLANKVREQITSSTAYQAAHLAGIEKTKRVQATYGPAIAQLQALIRTLEGKANAALAHITDEVSIAQSSVLTGLDIPTQIDQYDLASLSRPLYRPDFDYYAHYKTTPGQIPDNLESLLT